MELQTVGNGCVALHIHSRVTGAKEAAGLVRAALLHDYFLYDWHTPDPAHRLHGFRHAGTALRNADRDFELNDTERDMIKKHMFPLNPAPPRFKETAVLCLADKYCALRETVLQRKKANK